MLKPQKCPLPRVLGCSASTLQPIILPIAIGAMAGGAVTMARVVRRMESMRAWEHSYVYWSGQSHSFCVFTEDGLTEHPIEADEAQGERSAWDARNRLIARLGREGWELVGTNE